MSQTPRAKDVFKSSVKQKAIWFTMVKHVRAKPSQNGAGTKDSLVCLIGNMDSNDSFIHQSIIHLFQGTHQLIHKWFQLVDHSLNINAPYNTRKPQLTSSNCYLYLNSNLKAQ